MSSLATAVGHDFLMFSADDDVIARRYLWHGPDAYERPIVTDWVRWVSNAAVVYDIGAYTGLMSVLAAVCNPTSRVEAFEPLERTVERAHINMVANSVSDRVSLHAAAASDTNGSAEINLRRGAAFLGTGGSLYDKSRDYPTITVTEKKTIRTVRLDDYLPDGRPDVVKIDVEGHELATLRGMAASIAPVTPGHGRRGVAAHQRGGPRPAPQLELSDSALRTIAPSDQLPLHPGLSRAARYTSPDLGQPRGRAR